MKDARTVCHEHDIYEHRAIHAAEIMRQVIIDDLQAMMLQDRIRPLHERLAEYIANNNTSHTLKQNAK